MKKRVKRVLIATGAVLGLLILLGAAYIAIFQSEINKMASVETQEVIEGVYAIQDTYVNLFLIKGDNGYIAVDAGNNAKHIRQELDRLNIEEQEVVAVFLTHTDVDHIAALSLFNNATIYISQAEEQMIDGRRSRFLFFKNTLDYEYELVEDGQTINISGLKVQGILTPGHTPGAMCYLVDDTYLFTGDTMSLNNGQADLFNDFFNMDSEVQRTSLERLADLSEVKYIFTAHYGFTENHAEAFANWTK